MRAYDIATAATDNTVKVHDVRQLRTAKFTLPCGGALAGVVTTVKFCGGSLMTAAYDGQVKLWDAATFRHRQSLSCGGLELTNGVKQAQVNKVMSADICDKWICAASYDCSFRLFNSVT